MAKLTIQKSLELDQQHLWHPYTIFQDKQSNKLITRADGCFIYTAEGEKLFDATSSWWSKAYGHNNASLNQALIDQLQDLSHVMFAGITHPSAIELVRQLSPLLPKNLSAYFYSDSGSIATEVALKLSLQYQSSLAHDQGIELTRKRFVTFVGDYHGDTWHAMAVSDKQQLHQQFHEEFAEIMPQYYFIDHPPFLTVHQDLNHYIEQDPSEAACYQQFKNLLHNNNDIAGLIIEPIIQGAAGMKFYHPDYLKPLIGLAKQHKIVVIFDEIATGFGRTGKNFALDYFPPELHPDIVLLGKALTGGYLGLGLTIVEQQLATQISKYYPALHGPTFMANPLACAVASAAVKFYREQVTLQRINQIENYLLTIKQFLSGRSEFLRDVRVVGPIAVVEFNQDFSVEQRHFLQINALQNGIYLRPFANIAYLMVPYTVSDDELDKLIVDFCKVIIMAINSKDFQIIANNNKSYV